MNEIARVCDAGSSEVNNVQCFSQTTAAGKKASSLGVIHEKLAHGKVENTRKALSQHGGSCRPKKKETTITLLEERACKKQKGSRQDFEAYVQNSFPRLFCAVRTILSIRRSVKTRNTGERQTRRVSKIRSRKSNNSSVLVSPVSCNAAFLKIA